MTHWDAEQVRHLFSQLFPGRGLVLVSNREPYVHNKRDGRIVVDKPAGGLTAALDPVMQGLGGTWVAWGSGDADREVSPHGLAEVPPDDPRYRLRRVWLSPREVRGFYEGYSNRILWPLCHLMIERMDPGAASWYQYARVNRKFAEQAAAAAGERDVVWVHDYQLAMAPLFVHSQRPDCLVASFWHIPWPPYAAFRFCPHATQIIRGLLGCHLLGFQTEEYARSFLECVEKHLGSSHRVTREWQAGPWQAGKVEEHGHCTYVGAFPISIDYRAFSALASSPAAATAARRVLRRMGINPARRRVLLGVAVDRLDYTKGILERLAALERFFTDYPQYREKVSLVQVVAPSRTGVPDYGRLRRDVTAAVQRLNAEIGSDRWQPVYSIDHKLGHTTLAGLYRLADFAIVSSVYDGMNLVAKEYVAARADGDGVLLLSETAGAAAELEQAIPVNPFHPAGFAGAIRTAVEMPVEERKRRMAALRTYVSGHDIFHWVADFFQALASLPTAMAPETTALAIAADPRPGLLRGQHARGTTLDLLLDLDGTLAPLASTPAEARVPASARDLLRKLHSPPHRQVWIVTGRRISDALQLVGLRELGYAGIHGLEVGWPTPDGPHIDYPCPEVREAIPAVRAAVSTLRHQLSAMPGVVVEDKELSVAVHFRLVSAEQREQIRELVMRAADQEPLLRVLPGHHMLELRPDVKWDKGRAALTLLERARGDRWWERTQAIYVGDDITDEDAFSALGGLALTIKVGPGETVAQYRLSGPEEVLRFLNVCLRIFPVPE